MEITTVTFDFERSKKLYEKYFSYEQKRLFRKIPSYAILLVGLGFILLGWFMHVNFLISFGLAMYGVLGVVRLYYTYQFQSVKNKFFKELKTSEFAEEQCFKFKFDSERIIHESENSNTEITWKMIQSYFINDGDIYLFTKNKQLYDIISQSIIGLEHYEKFRVLLVEKVNPIK